MNDPETWPSIDGVAQALREAARAREDDAPYVTVDVARRDRLDAERFALLGHLYVGA